MSYCNPQKNKKRNAFFYFMLDWKKDAEARGRKFRNGLKDVQGDAECSQTWKNLSKDDKDWYEELAKKNKPTPELKTTLGESIRELDEKKKMEVAFVKSMHKYVETTLKMGAEQNNLPKLTFCFMHVNCFFERHNGQSVEHFPAEYAIGAFSLENGIDDVYHEIVSTPIPLGYKREALETSKSTHNIPIEYEGGENDFVKMREKLLNFLESRKIGNAYPPIFTLRSLGNIVRSVLTQFNNEAREDEPELLVYDLEILFANYAKLAYINREDRIVSNISVIADCIFQRIRFPLERGFECNFHKFIDGGCEQCSIAILKQWAFTMCDEFCAPFDVDMVKGIHYPSEVPNVTDGMADLKITHDSPQSSDTHKTLNNHTVKAPNNKAEVEIPKETPKEDLCCWAKPTLADIVKRGGTRTPGNEIATNSMENVPNYLNERQLRRPQTLGYAADAAKSNSDFDREKYSFPPIGGRGMIFKSYKEKTEKLPIGRGRGFF